MSSKSSLGQQLNSARPAAHPSPSLISAFTLHRQPATSSSISSIPTLALSFSLRFARYGSTSTRHVRSDRRTDRSHVPSLTHASSTSSCLATSGDTTSITRCAGSTTSLALLTTYSATRMTTMASGTSISISRAGSSKRSRRRIRATKLCPTRSHGCAKSRCICRPWTTRTGSLLDQSWAG
ncbi:hypothetical protein BJY59DRAFT_213287 [Rhodotorula toruloides]